jgi:vacuolar-type H+-ATPase subunit I/STV1
VVRLTGKFYIRNEWRSSIDLNHPVCYTIVKVFLKLERMRTMAVILDEITRRLREVFTPDQVEVLTDMFKYTFDRLVKASDFAELKGIVAELAEAQKQTEVRLNELAEAQKQTEMRLNELAEAQKQTEMRLNELAEAQKQTEVRLNELAEAQRRTEERLNELAEAQIRTEEELRKLTQEHRETRRQLGGLTITVGYTLENEAFKALPDLLKRDYGLELRERLKRTYVRDKEGKAIEVNIIGKAVKDGREVTILGEGKAQLSKRDVDRFLRRKVNRLRGVLGDLFLVLVTHMTSEYDVEEYVREKGIALYYSYDF